MVRQKNTKFGLFCYDTENIGDEIQSIAAKRFLPRIDYYINRDNIDDTNFKANETVKLIMNGWYIEPSLKDGSIHWPPKNNAIDPLLTSVHVSFLNGSLKTFDTAESRTFLQKHAPVGARDRATEQFLKTIGVPSFFSGCLTLTLIPDKKIKKSDFILAVDISPRVLQAIKKRTSRKILAINTVHNRNYTTEERFDLAKYWLYLYQTAHCIITTRLHAMLPGLAFGTPVIAITGKDAERFSGLIELVNHYTPINFIRNNQISVDNPLKNPDLFHPIRNSLVRACSEFTNYDSKSSFLDGLTVQELLNKPTFSSIISKSVEEAFNEKHLNLGHQQELSRLYNEENRLKNEISQLQDEREHFQTIIAEKDSKITSLSNPSIKSASKALLRSIKHSCFKTNSG